MLEAELGVHPALITALADRGNTNPEVAVQQSLRAYAAPPVAAAAKLRRFA